MKYFISNSIIIEQPNQYNIVQTGIETLEEWIIDKQVVEIDTETVNTFTDFSGLVFTFQVGDSENQFVLDCTDPQLVEMAKYILEQDHVVKILQNAKYDIMWFLKWGINPKNIYDTMLAEVVLNCGIKDVGYSLDVIGMRHLGVNISKVIRGKINYLGLVPVVIDYAAGDVEYLSKIRDIQIKKANSLDLLNTINLENEAVRVIAEMEYNGIKLDSTRWLEITKDHEKETLLKKRETIDYLATRDYIDNQSVQYDLFSNSPTIQGLNLNSSKQVIKILRNIGKKVGNKTLASIDTANEKVIEHFAYLDDFIKMYLDYKTEVSTITKYGKKFLNNINNNTGRIHPDFWQVVNTGRLSCRNPNLQNIKAGSKHRNAFIPEEGYLFTGADFSSQELVLIAEDSKEPIWVEATLNGWDLHSYVAEMVFKSTWLNAAESDCLYYIKKDRCSCKKHKELRDVIKTINYALAYGAGYNKIAAQLRIAPEVAKDIIEEYFLTMSTLKEHFNTLAYYAQQNLQMRTFKPIRRSRFFEPPSEDNYDKDFHAIGRQGMNSRFQGTGADMTKLALVNLHKHFRAKYPKDAVKFILQVHDEIILEARQDIAKEVLDDQISIMRDTSKVFLKTLVVNAEGSVMEYWQK